MRGVYCQLLVPFPYSISLWYVCQKDLQSSVYLTKCFPHFFEALAPSDTQALGNGRIGKGCYFSIAATISKCFSHFFSRRNVGGKL